jgi:BirA family biotin operon repressor/biotin-[acetyl-CoA-carboxylase] ligase
MSSSINELQGFSLATALAIKEAISPAIKQPINLKWPNDLLIDDNKLGGILIETAS